MYYTIQQAQKILPVSRATYYRLHRAGKIKFVKVGRRTLIDAASITGALNGGADDESPLQKNAGLRALFRSVPMDGIPLESYRTKMRSSVLAGKWSPLREPGVGTVGRKQIYKWLGLDAAEIKAAESNALALEGPPRLISKIARTRLDYRMLQQFCAGACLDQVALDFRTNKDRAAMLILRAARTNNAHALSTCIYENTNARLHWVVANKSLFLE